MAHGLLISDHDLINDLYHFNLKAYVDLGLTTKNSLDEGLKLIELEAYGDIIITLSQIDGRDAALEVINLLEKIGKDVPVIVIGAKSQVSNTGRVSTLPANLNIPLIVKKCAEILGITAQDMMLKSVPDFYPMPISLLETFSECPCSVFVKTSRSASNNDYIQVLEKGSIVTGKVLSYKEKGLGNLFIPSSLRLDIVNKASQVVMSLLDDPDLEVEQRLEATEQGYDIVGGLLGEAKEVTPEVVEISKKCMESVAKVINEVPRAKNLLLSMLENKTGYLYLHSVMGTYIAHHIIKEISWGSEEHAEKLSFVFFFHDMFLAPIFARHPELQFEEDLLFHDSLEEIEKEVVLNHARLASEMVKSFPRCPLGADAIILQHHGTTNGMGFTLDYKDDISPLAKVLIISEGVVEELIRCRNEVREPILTEIISNLHKKFTKHTYKKIINCLDTISF
jgi:HD-GYP domain-containing protein (c-di-GMP phosphodiesterase class II)